MQTVFPSSNKILFSDFYYGWLKQHRRYIQENTYNAYYLVAHRHIVPYFREKNLYLQNVTEDDLLDYYFYKLDCGLSPNTIRHHHANLHSALDYAKSKNLVLFNPAKDITLPRRIVYHSEYYTLDEINLCLLAFKGHKLEICVLLAAILGLRRSEVLGLTWENVDFRKKQITIRKTVVYTVDPISGKGFALTKNRTKSASSYRKLALPDIVLKSLLRIKKSRKKISPNDFVVLDELGNPFKPDYITKGFKKHLIKSNLKIIRFHDLRHSCATMLYQLEYDLKDIQMWLGHSDIQTTANLYTHYSFDNKKKIAQKINERFFSVSTCFQDKNKL